MIRTFTVPIPLHPDTMPGIDGWKLFRCPVPYCVRHPVLFKYRKSLPLEMDILCKSCKTAVIFA